MGKDIGKERKGKKKRKGREREAEGIEEIMKLMGRERKARKGLYQAGRGENR